MIAERMRERRIVEFASLYLLASSLMIIITYIFSFFGMPAWVAFFVAFFAVAGLPVFLVYRWIEGGRQATPAEPPPRGEVWLLDRPIPVITARPSIVVLPFEPGIADERTDRIGTGVATELIWLLVQETNFFVISRNSSLAWRDANESVQTIGREAGVGHVLEGQITISGNRVRIGATLRETTNEREVWSTELAAALPDIFDVILEIYLGVCDALGGSVRSWRKEDIKYHPPASIEAWICYIAALEKYRLDDPAAYMAAATMIRECIDLDPEFSRARALYARALATIVSQNLTRFPDEDGRVALLAARASVQQAGDDLEVLANCSEAFLHLGHRADAIETAGRGELLGAESGPISAALGFCRVALGDSREGINEYSRAIRQSPRDTELSTWIVGVGIAYTQLGEYSTAVDFVRRGTELQPDSFLNWTLLANACGLEGDTISGLEAMVRARELLPSLTIHLIRSGWRAVMANERDAELLTAGLTAMGLEDPLGANTRADGDLSARF